MFLQIRKQSSIPRKQVASTQTQVNVRAHKNGMYYCEYQPGNATKYIVWCVDLGVFMGEAVPTKDNQMMVIWDVQPTATAFKFFKRNVPTASYVYKKLCDKGRVGSLEDAEKIVDVIKTVLVHDNT